MKKEILIGLPAFLLLFCVGMDARAVPSQGTEVKVVVTAEPKRGKTIPELLKEDLKVTQNREKRQITSLESLAGSKLQLLLLIDDSAASGFDTQISALRDFVMALPANAEVEIGYMRNGMAQMTSPFTLDHAAAAATIRLADGRGGADVSPYDSLTDAVKKWPKTDIPRREVVMISSGIEGLGGGPAPENPYVDAGIESAQRAGVLVYNIYAPSAGRSGPGFGLSGQNFLSQLSDETGGVSYALLLGSAVSFEPYLKSILEAQQHQYLLGFLARPHDKAGLQPMKVSVLEKDAKVTAADKVLVPAQ
jgi:VWFA-related protein